METELQKRVLKVPVDGIENAYVAVSAGYRSKERDGIKKCMSFFYVADEKTIIEWEPEHGPITVIYKCGEDWKDEYNSAEPHWYFDYCTGQGNWAQLAVDENRLQEKFVNGDYFAIFRVLATYG